MYNATEQFAELNKTNVAQATKLAALALENAEKLVKLNLARRQGRAGAERRERAGRRRRSRTCRTCFALRAKFAEAGVQAATGYSRNLYELATEAQAEYTALAEEAWATYTKGVAAWVDKASKSAPAGSDVAVNAFKSTFAAIDRRVRPVPEGDEAGREPGRRERPRRRRQRDEGAPQGPQGCVTQPSDASCTMAARAGRADGRAAG